MRDFKAILLYDSDRISLRGFRSVVVSWLGRDRLPKNGLNTTGTSWGLTRDVRGRSGLSPSIMVQVAAEPVGPAGRLPHC